jgi:hypothetical protein
MFKFFFCLGLPLFGMAQIQVFFPKTNPKEHQRALITLANGQILSGSSEANIRLHKSKGQVQQSINLGASFKEIRDLTQTPNGFIALQSHDSSGLVLLNKSLEIDTIIYPLQIRAPLFLDGICAQENLVFLLGDPVGGFFSTFYSIDGGLHWQATPAKVSAHEGEAAYAASGQTNQMLNGHFYFVSGGLTSRLFHSPDKGATWNTSAIPYPSCPTCGPYAMTIKNETEIMTVGGSYLEPNNAQNTCFYSKDGGKSWGAPKKGPSGYRSCVIRAGNNYYACGTNGIDVSKNGGKTWKKISNENALSMTFAGEHIVVSLANGSWLVLQP